MQELVFIDSQRVGEEPYTTSDIIAEYAESDRDTVNKLIRTYASDLKEFGVYGFEICKPPKGSHGGRPRKIWHLNQEQASLIITYMGNTKPVREFKKALIHQFFNMYQLLAKQQAMFEAGKPVSKELNQAINDNPNFTHGRLDYININRMIYQFALGVSSAQLKKERHFKKGHSITEYLSADEATAMQRVKERVIMLLEMNLDRAGIKSVLERQGILYQVTLTIKQEATAQ